MLSRTLPNQEKVDLRWDAMGRCTAVDSRLFKQDYTYDAVGNLVELVAEDQQGDYLATYTYDPLNQLLNETGPLANDYEWDSLYNRRTKNDAPCVINELNQLTDDSQHDYAYDLCGRRTEKGAAQYTYDALGRLLAYEKDDKRIVYQYDPFGRRIARDDGERAVRYLYQSDTEVGVYEQGELTEFRAIYGEFSPFALELAGEVYSPIRDLRGNICVLLDSVSSPVSNYRYDAFGAFIASGSIASPWRFSGQRYDVDTGLYHFAKREYDPVAGRWLTPDPLGFADGPNLYAYVHNNPLIYVDPYGLWGEYAFSFLSGSKNLAGGLTRGVVDDMTVGMSTLALGEYNNPSSVAQAGWYVGTGASIVAGLFYGATVLKAAGVVGRAGARLGLRSLGNKAVSVVKSTSLVEKTTRWASNVLRRVRPAAPAQKTIPKISGLETSISKWLGKETRCIKNKVGDPIFI